MAIEEQTLAELQTQCIANKETALSTTVPTQPKAFLRVESVTQAALLKLLEKRVVYAQRQCLAATAMLDALKTIGRGYALSPELAVATQMTVSFTAAGGSTMSAGTEMTSDDTGALYTVNTTVGESGGTIVATVTAADPGSAANLANGSGMTLTSGVAGVSDAGTVASTTVTGSDDETKEEFRRRVLAAQRSANGGGNLSDYRTWAEDVSGVLRAFPYSGRPILWRMEDEEYISFANSDSSLNFNDPGRATTGFLASSFGTLVTGDILVVSGSTSNDGAYTVQSISTLKIVVAETLVTEAYGASVTLVNQALPGDRTVFIEADTATRIPSESLLDSVREGINYDDTGIYRPDGGDIDATLYVEPITITQFYIEVYGLDVDATQEATVKAKILTDAAAYFENARPFITGLDFEMDRTDTITDLAISKVFQEVLESYGASAEALLLRVGSAGSEVVSSYQLGQGELAKLEMIFTHNGAAW